MPDPARIAEIREPFIRATIITPKEFIGVVMELCRERRGTHVGMHYLSPERVQLTTTSARGDRDRLLRPAESRTRAMRRSTTS